MIPEHLVFIDLETTGTNTLHDRITEVGFYEVKKGTVVKEWSSLINPGKNISPFIEQITGITTAMVADAPKFSDIADELFVSVHTINSHRKNILKKLNLKSPAELIVYAIETGLVKV